MPTDDFALAIGRYLLDSEAVPEQVLGLIQRVLSFPPAISESSHRERLREIAIDPPRREQIQALQREIRETLGAQERIALVYGGATKIKEYVFEAARLPEVRGASGLLDWVNEVHLPALWQVQNSGSEAQRRQQLIEKGLVYAGGGNILAFAPASQGDALATEIEHTYTDETLTANSYGVAETFSLLELRFGRLAWSGDELRYWVEDFERDWTNRRAELEGYYYLPSDAVEDGDSETFKARLRFFNRKGFGELVTLLATKANRRRDERNYGGVERHLPIFPTIPWAVKCDSSDVRPVVLQQRADPQREEQPPQLSEASARKYKAGRILKKAGTDTGLDALHWDPKGIDERSWETLWQRYLVAHPELPYCRAAQQSGAPDWNWVYPPQDLGELGQASRPDRYIGVIYADGNNVGRVVATTQTPDAMHGLSLALRDAAREAVFGALTQHLAPTKVRTDRNNERWIHPFEILSIGGDDLFLLVPGDRACDIALTIGRAFEFALSESDAIERPHAAIATDQVKGRYAADTCFITEPYTPAIGLSAGVLIAPENTPIFFLDRLVNELLKSAKEKAKRSAQGKFYGGAIDFMALRSITMVVDKIKAFREQAYRTKGRNILTARPYSWHEFAGLLQTVRALKQAQVPRSQLYRLRRALQEDRAQTPLVSVMEYLYTRVRQSAYAQALTEHVERHWCYRRTADGHTGLPPWMPREGGWETMWADMVEIHDLIPEQP